jgi:hypothetical protein
MLGEIGKLFQRAFQVNPHYEEGIGQKGRMKGMPVYEEGVHTKSELGTLPVYDLKGEGQTSGVAKYNERIQAPPTLDRGITYARHGGRNIRVWEQVMFMGGSYYEGEKKQSYEQLVLPAATLVDLETQKTIEKTAIQGRKGTVKELISAEDWKITIRGILTPGCLDSHIPQYANHYPYEEVQRIRNLYEVNTPLEVIAEIFSTLGIGHLVIERLQLPRLEGYPTCQPYVLECLSDEDLTLELANL